MTPTAINHLLELINTGAPASLGPERRPDAQPLAALNRTLDEQLARAGVIGERGDLIRALVLLWHDHLDASHTISQGIESRDGSLVHGLMHRREPDYSNAKYWFRRVGKHPAFESVAEVAGELFRIGDHAPLAAQLLPRGEWDACAFVDACEVATARRAEDTRTAALRELQRTEFAMVLVHFCAEAELQ